MVVDKEPSKKTSADESQDDGDAFEDYLEEYDSLNRDMDQLSGFLDRLEQSTLEVQQKARDLLNLQKDARTEPNTTNGPRNPPSNQENGQSQS